MGHWKAVRKKFGRPLELYDLKTDLGETTERGREASEDRG